MSFPCFRKLIENEIAICFPLLTILACSELPCLSFESPLILFSDQIKVRQHDPEESVRLDVVNSLLAVARKEPKSMTPEMLQFVKERTLDKKVLDKDLT